MDFLDDIKNKIAPSSDYIFSTYKIGNKSISLIYNEVLTNTSNINEYVLEKIVYFKDKNLYNLEDKLPDCNIIIIDDSNITDYLNNGFVVIVIDKIYAIEFRANLDRGITNITSELSLCGPKDSFSEIFNTNLGLIRRRIKDVSLKNKTITLGKYTKTKIGILYIEGIVNIDLVKKVISKLERIDIDGIIDSSYLKKSLEESYQLFPTIMLSERPDKCSMALLEGKVVILVDNSCFGIILPSFFRDFFHTTDDYYQKSFNVSFIRIIRLLAFFIALFIPAIYISITTRDYYLVPSNLLLMLKVGRLNVPFPAYIEAFFMIICFEILKECDLRMSSISGSAISILGGLILGDAAVAAGIVSPIMIIVIAISSIAGLIFTSIELGNVIRTYKILLLILSTLFGIYGILLGIIILIYDIFNTKVLGYSYICFDKNEIYDSYLKIDKRINKRNSKLTKNIIRGWFK